jgi:hypothetical protein
MTWIPFVMAGLDPATPTDTGHDRLATSDAQP